MVLNKRDRHAALVAAAAATAAATAESAGEVEGKGASSTLPPLDGPEWLLAHPRVRAVALLLGRGALYMHGGVCPRG
jgi:hypothetical protein